MNKKKKIFLLEEHLHSCHILGDQPELSKCMMLLLLKYKRKLVGDGLELKRIAECLLI